MTLTLLTLTLLGQTIEVPPDATSAKPAEPAPAPVPVPVAPPVPVVAPAPAVPVDPARAPLPAPTEIRPQSQAETKPTSRPAFEAGGLTQGLLFLPYWGINSALDAAEYSVGQRLGLFVGWNVTGNFALNAELALDVLDANSFSVTSKPSDKLVAIAASPLGRAYFGRSMWVFGPSLGYFSRDRWTYWSDKTYSEVSQVSSRGLTVGLTLGAFVPVGRVALGGLANIRIYKTTRTCTTSAYVYGGGGGAPREDCESSWNNEEDTKIVAGLAGAVLF
jgi:hypothetical protein